ncbi:MAG: hypothetical protein U0Q21_10830 [Dermatophilaceae bacterium]
MTVLTTTPVPLTTPEVPERRLHPFARQFVLELRKLTDTRAGLGLLLGVILLSALSLAGTIATALPAERTSATLLRALLAPQWVILPILGIVLVTGEFGKRTNASAFLLEPRRLRVLGAKVLAMLLVADVLHGVAVGLAALGPVVLPRLTGHQWVAAMPDSVFTQGLAVQFTEVLVGVAFGALIQSTAAAIAAFFTLPMIGFGAASAAGHGVVSWIDLSTTQTPLAGGTATSTDLLHFACAALLWAVLPLALGALRLRRRDLPVGG